MSPQELIGAKFGRWTITGRSHEALRRGASPKWVCVCDCGTTRSVVISDLKNGSSRSCGCLGRERSRTHWKTKTPEYSAWNNMRRRCDNPRHRQYKHYGGRGIAVCERWQTSFDAFLSDMGQRPTKDHTLERVNNNEGYGPSNCTWATRKQQNRNQRSSRLLSYDGRTMSLAAWAEHAEIDYKTFQQRIYNGWEVERALSVPVRISALRGTKQPKRPERLISFAGKTQTISKWSEDVGIPYKALMWRLGVGRWPIDKALTTPSLSQCPPKP